MPTSSPAPGERQALGHGPDPARVRHRAVLPGGEGRARRSSSLEQEAPARRSRSTPRSTPSRKACSGRPSRTTRSPRRWRRLGCVSPSARSAEDDEIQALQHVIKLYEAEAAAKKAVKDATAKLEEQALAQYPKLTTDDIQTLVIDDKWGGTIGARIDAEVTALGQALIARLRVLGRSLRVDSRRARGRGRGTRAQGRRAPRRDGG